MAKHEDTHRKATSHDDARLPATTRHNINETPQDDESHTGGSHSGDSQHPNTAKDINVVRGDNRPQAVRHEAHAPGSR